MSWIAVAIGGTAVAGGVAKAVTSNQQKQSNKGVIEGNYQLDKQVMQRNQQQVRQNTSEGLMQRGLTGGGLTPIQRQMAGANTHRQYTPGLSGASAMRDKASVDAWNAAHEHDIAPAAAPGSAHTLGAQLQVDNDKQFQLEQTDLEQQRARAEKDNNAAYMNALVDAGVSTAQGVVGAVGAHGDIAAMGRAQSGGTTPNGAPSPIRSQMMSGAGDASNWAFGVVGNDPLNAAGSSWNRSKTSLGTGLTNDQFHV